MKDDVRRQRPDGSSIPRRVIPLAVEGARTNLGAVVTVAESGAVFGGKRVARVGDIASHPELGDAVITSGLGNLRQDGRACACAGSLTSRESEYILDPGQSNAVGVEHDDGHVELRASAPDGAPGCAD